MDAVLRHRPDIIMRGPDQRIHEVQTAGLQMTAFVPNASLDLKDAITHSLSGDL